MYIYLQNLKNPTVRFEVVEYDKESKTARLRGEYGAEFTRNVSKESLAKFGYKLVRSEEPLALNSVPKIASAPPPADDDDEEAPPPPPKKKGKKKVAAAAEEE